MNIRRIERCKEATVYGSGSPGGKGLGLIRVNECDLPRANKLPTHILTTVFYQRYLERDRNFGTTELAILKRIHKKLGSGPIGVRSSATDEAGVSDAGFCEIHAGENISFMLPNNHGDPAVRFSQFEQAIGHIYSHFMRHHTEDKEQMAIVINPIPGVFDDTRVGPVYYPYISGVANSFFPHALKTQDARDGFARIAFGHGYATVLDDFPVISMATIRNPIPIEMMQIGGGQQYFYALDMTTNRSLRGDELETMLKLHVRFANFHKIKLLGMKNQILTIEELVQNDHFGFKTGLIKIMETISSRISSHFQIEFVFNLDFSRQPLEDGFFHVVQLTLLPEMTFKPISLPDTRCHTYLSISNLQGHGVKRGLKYAIVVSPFLYTKERHDEVRERLSRLNQEMGRNSERYLMIVPGRLGSKNRDWGIEVQFRDVDQAAAIFEYGVDIAGRAEPLPEQANLTGGVYGSHFLYMVMGGCSEEQRILQTRMYGTQGTHFLTNLMSRNVFYGYVSPFQDKLDSWFFCPPEENEAIYVLAFPKAVDIYADSLNKCCLVVSQEG